MNLAEAVKLKSILKSKFYEYTEELHRVAFITVEKDEEATNTFRSMSEVEKDLARIRQDIRTLDRLVYEANTKNHVTFEDKEWALVEAIELASQLREEASLFRHFSEQAKQTVENNTGDIILYRVAQYEPDEYRERADVLEKKAHRLSNAINAKNYTIIIDFDDSFYF